MQGEWGIFLIIISLYPNIPDHINLGLTLIIFRNLNEGRLPLGSTLTFMGILLLLLPWISGFRTKAKAQSVLTIIGISLELIALNLLLTNTNMGVVFAWGAGLGVVGAWILVLTNVHWNLMQTERDPGYNPTQQIRERIKKRPFKIRQDTEKVLKLSKCPVCKAPLKDSSSDFCESCNTKLIKCPICKQPINKENLIFCPFCSSPFHKTEFLEWLKVHANCPRCKNELDMWEFQKHLEESKNELSKIQCPECKKFIPNDCNYCIFCGFKI